MSDISNMKAPCSVDDKQNYSTDAMDDSSICKVDMEHCSKDEVTVKNILVDKVAAVEEESEDTELGNFFMEDDSSNVALPPEVLMIQSKARTRAFPTSKDLEKLEGIWKKVL